MSLEAELRAMLCKQIRKEGFQLSSDRGALHQVASLLLDVQQVVTQIYFATNRLGRSRAKLKPLTISFGVDTDVSHLELKLQHHMRVAECNT